MCSVATDSLCLTMAGRYHHTMLFHFISSEAAASSKTFSITCDLASPMQCFGNVAQDTCSSFSAYCEMIYPRPCVAPTSLPSSCLLLFLFTALPVFPNMVHNLRSAPCLQISAICGLTLHLRPLPLHPPAPIFLTTHIRFCIVVRTFVWSSLLLDRPFFLCLRARRKRANLLQHCSLLCFFSREKGGRGGCVRENCRF